ncbi:hypothetical protein B6E66_23590 [Streptomyces maremycinicus]|nr:hypothetical protein B6E66_23590 [Streptomyces sp. B9173]
MRYPDEVTRWYQTLWEQGVTVDITTPRRDLTGYRVLLVPNLYSISATDAERIAAAARSGTSVLVTCFSGIVDAHDHVRLGGCPGAFRELPGIRSTPRSSSREL